MKKVNRFPGPSAMVGRDVTVRGATLVLYAPYLKRKETAATLFSSYSSASVIDVEMSSSSPRRIK